MRGNRARGFTVIELLASLTFLSLCAGPMVTAISNGEMLALNAQDRALVLGTIMDQIDTKRSTALTTALTTGTTNSTVTVSGVYTTVALTTVISLVSGYSDLYSIDVKGSWGNQTIPNRNGSIEIITYVRAPHA